MNLKCGKHVATHNVAGKWRMISLLGVVPFVATASFFIISSLEEREPPPFYPYPHMRIRHKQFPWRGGTDESLFHNPRVNATTTGYSWEEDPERKANYTFKNVHKRCCK
ncbi:cytochrome c oxidase subunit 6A2, mitochondrial-like [Agrilus planipennis]|uniref:Cytochrome c oxidase subunit 6A2, mitochondrial-like n=1 Tax=Agrilus planipennis TaxID=224129 RepID=A0A7F5RAV7_AGRPL|nr:cytochrome c oxidase subunit 6A2, mitochondrial-like [Agrilus planipennis]